MSNDTRPTDPVPALDPMTAGLLNGLRIRMSGLSESQRVAVFCALQEDFCRACGSTRGKKCHCETDE